MQLEPCDLLSVGCSGTTCSGALGIVPEDMFEELKLFPLVENEDHIDESLATAADEKMDTPSSRETNSNHDNGVGESQETETGGEKEVLQEIKIETHKPAQEEQKSTQNGTTEEIEVKPEVEKKPVVSTNSNGTPTEADSIKEFLGRKDTAVIFPEPVSDLDEEQTHNTDAVSSLDEDYILKCVHCSESYTRATLLRDHMKSRHPDKEVKFQCPKCDEVFLLKTQLDKHIALHSPTSQNCKICNKTFANVYRLQRHMISHDESTDLRKFKCPECAKAFKFKHHLKEHIRIHSGEKPFECPNCGKRFSHSGSYSSHMTSKKCWVMNMKGRRVDRNGNNENVMFYRSPGQTFNDSLQSPPPGSYPQQFLKYDPRNAGLPTYFPGSLGTSPVRPLGMVAYSLYSDNKTPGHLVLPPKLSPPTIECQKPSPCSTSPVSRAPQISPDVNSNTQLLNLAASEKKLEGPELLKLKEEPDEANKGSRASSPHESAKCETPGEYEHKTNNNGEMLCRFCNNAFKSPVELHQHERYLCKLNKDVVLRMAHLENSRSSPNSTVSDASYHATPNGSIGDEGTDEEPEEIKDENGQVDKKYRMRSLISDQQLQFLRAHYQVNPRPGKQELIKIASDIGFSKRVVQVWFQNMRARDRRKGKDVPYFPNMARFKAGEELPVTTCASAYIPVVPQPFSTSALSVSQSSSPSPKLNGQLTSHSLPSTPNKPQMAVSNQEMPLDLTVKRHPPKAHCNSTPSPPPSYSEDQALNLSCKSSPTKEESVKDPKPPASSSPTPRLEGSFHQSAIFKYMQQEGLFRNNISQDIPKTTSTLVPDWTVPSIRIAPRSSPPAVSRSSPSRQESNDAEATKSPRNDDEDSYSSDSSSDSSDSQHESDAVENCRLVIDETDPEKIAAAKNDALFHHNLRTLADVSLAHMEGELADHLGKSKRLRKKSWRQVEAEESNLDLDLESLNGDDEPLRKKRKSWKNHKIDVEIGMYACDQCEKMFSKQSSLARHKYEHSGARPFSCEVCGKAFKHKHHLTEHKRLHSGEKPFQCKKCSKRFSHSGSFSQHMNHRYKYCKPNDGEED